MNKAGDLALDNSAGMEPICFVDNKLERQSMEQLCCFLVKGRGKKPPQIIAAKRKFRGEVRDGGL